ncbi:hypothetical protein GCM10010381_31260 [Streptomyces xantholiticus]|nr:hypothetical protein GCM10010381_31260 [Streptomyces xantholiticus]
MERMHGAGAEPGFRERGGVGNSPAQRNPHLHCRSNPARGRNAGGTFRQDVGKVLRPRHRA